MDGARPQRVLAIGLDSAEPTLVREMIERGELPALAALVERGEWRDVDPGPGAVWDTFITGTTPYEHGTYNGWQWKPEEMACRNNATGVRPRFWDALEARGIPVGILDVPEAVAAPVSSGFEVTEWGPHHQVLGSMRAFPSRANRIVREAGRHPFAGLRETPLSFDRPEQLAKLHAACLTSARMRAELAMRLIEETQPALSIVCFTEIHHAAHQLWHTLEPEHPVYAARSDGDGDPGLHEIIREVDRQAGRLIDAVGPDTAVVAFSVHGIRATDGIPMFLEPLLVALGWAVPAGWEGVSWRTRARTTVLAAKARVPLPARRLYERYAGHRLKHRIAKSTIVPPYDWRRTRAFSLPTDQHGFVRVNLAGREAEGCVAESDYTATCEEIEAALRATVRSDGAAVVRDVIRPADVTGKPPAGLPDLIVEWEDAAYEEGHAVRCGSTEVEMTRFRADRTGQHTENGFCILDRRLAADAPETTIRAADLHRFLTPRSRELSSSVA